MKDFKKKEDNKEEIDIQSLTGSPSPTAVSDVAKGGKAETMMEHEDEQNTEWVERLNNEQTKDIEEAYAMLFESLAIIARSHSKEEKSESC